MCYRGESNRERGFDSFGPFGRCVGVIVRAPGHVSIHLNENRLFHVPRIFGGFDRDETRPQSHQSTPQNNDSSTKHHKTETQRIPIGSVVDPVSKASIRIYSAVIVLLEERENTKS
jgi:hypothetical protein